MPLEGCFLRGGHTQSNYAVPVRGIRGVSRENVIGIVCDGEGALYIIRIFRLGRFVSC